MKSFLAAKAKEAAQGVVLTKQEKKEETKKEVVEPPAEKDIIINSE